MQEEKSEKEISRKGGMEEWKNGKGNKRGERKRRDGCKQALCDGAETDKDRGPVGSSPDPSL